MPACAPATAAGPAPAAIVVQSRSDVAIEQVRAVGLAAAGQPSMPVRTCSTTLELYVRAALAEPGSVLVVDVTPERGVVWRPAERVITRLVQRAGVDAVIAWGREIGPDVICGAFDAGARSVLTVGTPPSGPQSAQDWCDWLADRGIPDRPWTELALALLAETGERAVLAQALHASGTVASQARGVAALRSLAQALASDEYRSPWLVATEAHAALEQLALLRPLRVRPQAAVSLDRAVELLRLQPSLAVAALLGTRELADLRALTATIARGRESEQRTVGAPVAGQTALERRWAAGQLALERHRPGDDVDVVAEAILQRGLAAAHAIHDVARESSRAAAPRAAAALHAAAMLPTRLLPRGVRLARHGAVWQGRTASELLEHRSWRPGELAAVTKQIDVALRGVL
jgi:hypothetical protein